MPGSTRRMKFDGLVGADNAVSKINADYETSLYAAMSSFIIHMYFWNCIIAHIADYAVSKINTDYETSLYAVMSAFIIPLNFWKYIIGPHMHQPKLPHSDTLSRSEGSISLGVEILCCSLAWQCYPLAWLSPFEIVSLSYLLAEIGMSGVVAPFSTASSATFAALYTGCRISLK